MDAIFEELQTRNLLLCVVWTTDDNTKFRFSENKQTILCTSEPNKLSLL